MSDPNMERTGRVKLRHSLYYSRRNVVEKEDPQYSASIDSQLLKETV